MAVRNIIPFVSATAVPMSRATYYGVRLLGGAFVLGFLAAGWYFFSRRGETPVADPESVQQPASPRVEEGESEPVQQPVESFAAVERKYEGTLSFLGKHRDKLTQEQKDTIARAFGSVLPHKAFELLSNPLTLEGVQAAIQFKSETYQEKVRDRLKGQLGEISAENIGCHIGLLYLNKATGIESEALASEIWQFADNNEISLLAWCSLLQMAEKGWLNNDITKETIQDKIIRYFGPPQPSGLIDQHLGFSALLDHFSPRNTFFTYLLSQAVRLLESHNMDFLEDSQLEMWLDLPVAAQKKVISGLSEHGSTDAQIKKTLQHIEKLMRILVQKEITGAVNFKSLACLTSYEPITHKKYAQGMKDTTLSHYTQIKKLTKKTGCLYVEGPQHLRGLNKILLNIQRKTPGLYVESCLYVLSIQIELKSGESRKAAQLIENIENDLGLTPEQIMRIVLLKKQLADWA